ncbi:hypothetical protein GCM10023335_75090 [Streptomyces siamensis]|uniref:Uncharacterized protein n=1 Tax=Streptomyces siamensis TaxID=1274986 RepID=A0ABP9JHP7_9ACTN
MGAGGEGDQLPKPSARRDKDLGAGLGLLQAEAEVDTVGPRMAAPAHVRSRRPRDPGAGWPA